MDKRWNYINYIVDDVLKKVDIDEEENRISFPWMMQSLAYHYRDSGTYYPFTYDEIMNISPFRNKIFKDNDMFDHYIQTQYGATDAEVYAVWVVIKKRLLSIVVGGSENHINLNESEGARTKFYEYVVDDLMGRMVMDAPDFIFIGDDVDIDYRGVASRSVFSIYHKFNNELIDHLITNYGVRNNDNELNRIWFRFRNRVREEILRPSEDEDYWISD